MAKDYPVGAAQKKVLEALGMSASGFADAERIFDEIGIVVASKRGTPQVSRKATSGGGWNPGMEDGDSYEIKFREVDLTPLAQWMA